MTQSPFTTGDLVRMSFTQPRVLTQVLTRMALPVPLLWQGLVAIVVISVVFEFLVLAAFGGAQPIPDAADPMTQNLINLINMLYANPIAMAAVQFGLLVVSIIAVHRIGVMLGGVGRFEDVLVMLVWFQVLIFGLQVFQILVSLVLAPAAGLIGLITLVAFFYLLTMFITELHGFNSPGMVLVGIFAFSFAMVFALAILAVLVGSMFGGGAGNV